MLLEVAASIIVCTVYCACALCLGALVLRVIARKLSASSEAHALAVVTTQFLLGQAVLAAIWQLLALAGWFSPQIIVAFLALSLLGGVRFVMPVAAGFLRQLRGTLAEMRKEPPLWWAVYVLIMLLILMTGIVTINPPQPRGDAIAFYMALPKVVSASHQLLPLPGYEAFAQIGLLGEFHFAALMSLGGGMAAKMFLWPIALAAAAMLATISAKAGLGRRGQWIALAALFTSTAFTSIIWNGKVDLFSAALGLGAVAWSLETGANPRDAAIRLAGLLAGFAVLAKITYLVPLVPGLLLIVIWRFRATQDRERFFSRASLSALVGSIFRLGLCMAVPLLVNVLKNSVLYGQPLAPIITTADTTNWSRPWFKPETTSKILLTYPISLVYGQFWGQGGQMSPLMLAFLPLSVLLSRSGPLKYSRLAQITAAGLLGIVSWHLYSPSVFAPRYVMTSLLLLLPLAARGAEHVLELLRPRWSVLSIIVAGSILVSLLISIEDLTNFTKTGILRAIGRVSPCEMEQYGSDASCRIAELLNEDAAPEERVFLAAYYRYWYRPDIIQCLNTTPETEEFDSIAGAELRWTYLLEHGYRYVVIDEITHGDVLQELDLDRLPEGMEVSAVFEDWPFVVYRIDALDSSTPPLLICAQVDPPAWKVIPVGEQ